MATARRSENAIYHLLKRRGLSVETIGCANAPRTVYEATFEEHRSPASLGFRNGAGQARTPRKAMSLNTFTVRPDG